MLIVKNRKMIENYLLVIMILFLLLKLIKIFFSFSGGLTWDTTQEDLREYFSNFGNILDCSIKHDPTTGRSRGFAFLVFDRKDIVEKILSQNEHFVKGRKVDPKPAHRRLTVTNNNHMSSSSSSSSSISNNNRKVFVGGLDPNFPDVQLREYFSQFGTIDGKINKIEIFLLS
jgi:RNA recognition motif-containing protein